MRFFLDDFFTEFRLNRNLFNRIFLGISEVVSNAIIHGNRLNTDKNVFIQLTLNENEIVVVVKDEGDGFCIKEVEDPTCSGNLKKEHGRGIFLVRQIADEVEYAEQGRKVLIKFFLANEHTIL